MLIAKKRNYLAVGLLVFLVVLTGCSNEDVDSNQNLVLKSVTIKDCKTLEATFNDGSIKTISDFTPRPLKEGDNKVEFTYNGVNYDKKVNYTSGQFTWQKVEVTDANGLSVLEVSANRGDVKLDKVLVTDDLDYDPSKAKQNSKPTSVDNNFYFEAEEINSQQDSSSYKVQESNQASQGKYVASIKQEKEDENLQFNFNLSGEIAIWLRVSKNDTFSVDLKEESISGNKEFKTNGETYKLGLKPTSKVEYSSLPKVATLSEVTASSQVDLSADMPPIGNQGSQGSCVGWATAYAYKSYQEKQDHNWNVNTSKHQFSPAYVYNQINGGQDRGSSISDALNLIKKQGVSPLSVMPYNENDYRTQPNSRQREVASNYKAKRWGTLPAGDYREMKKHLTNGDTITVAIPVYPDFDISRSNPIYDNTNGSHRGWHAITFVGYSDSKSAFKFINSWGSRWGLSGYGWMSYNLVNRLDTRAYIMTDNQTDDDTNPDPEPEPDPSPSTNLAVDKPISVSDTYQSYRATNANDGNAAETFWATNAGYSSDWLMVDLEEKKEVSRVKVKWSSRNYATDYTIYCYNNGWERVATKSDGDGDWDELEFSQSVTGRYFYLRAENNNSTYYTVYEFELYKN